MKKVALRLFALTLFILSGLIGHANGFAYFSAMQVGDDYKRYGAAYAFMNYGQNIPEPYGIKTIYYNEGVARWAEVIFAKEQNTQTSFLRLIHGMSLLANATMYEADEVKQSPQIQNLLKKGYVSILASKVMERADMRRCRATQAENFIQGKGASTEVTAYEKILTQVLDKQQMETLWQEALAIEENNADRPISIYICFDTDKQLEELFALGAQKVTFKNPKTSQPVPITVFHPAPKSLPWTMDDATWNTARKEIRADSYRRWAQRFAENSSQ